MPNAIQEEKSKSTDAGDLGQFPLPVIQPFSRCTRVSAPQIEISRFERSNSALLIPPPCGINSRLNNNYVFTPERRQRDKRLWKRTSFWCHMPGLIYRRVRQPLSLCLLTSNKQLAPVIPQPGEREVLFYPSPSSPSANLLQSVLLPSLTGALLFMHRVRDAGRIPAETKSWAPCKLTSQGAASDGPPFSPTRCSQMCF